MAELFKILQPLQFMQTFLASGTRPDGRNFDEFRDVLISCDCITSADGSAMVKFGTSSVMCGITTTLAKPNIDRPEEGILEIDLRFSNPCSNELDNPDRTTISGYVRECIKKVLYHSKVLNMENLCLIPRKHCWKILLEIICLNMDGSIVDLSLMAALAALRKCKLQKYDIDSEFELITPTNQFENLEIKTYPIVNTFAIIEKHLLVDPTMNEEELSDSLIRIAVDPDEKTSDDSDSIYLLEVTGSTDLDQTILKNIYQKAMKRAKFLKQILMKHLQQNDSSNDLVKYETMEL